MKDFYLVRLDVTILYLQISKIKCWVDNLCKVDKLGRYYEIKNPYTVQ